MAYVSVRIPGSSSVFEAVRDKLSFEWLKRFPEMPWQARDVLFDCCAQYGDRADLCMLIKQRCEKVCVCHAVSEKSAKIRDFWYLRALFFLEDPPDEVWERFRSDRDAIFMIEARAGRFGKSDNQAWPNLSAKKIFRILDMYVEAWPKVFLPSSYGTGDPAEETAYRFLSDIVWRIDQDAPDKSIPVFDQLLRDPRFVDFGDALKSLRAAALRKRSMKDFRAPSAAGIVEMLDRNRVATVEDLRALLVEELKSLEDWVRHSETNPLVTFYANGKHIDENSSRDRIVDQLRIRMQALNLNVAIERYMADMNRCDITISAMINGQQHLLVIEVKGQWHKELFTAASAQLYERYSSHPDAAQQGIYLVLWFGPEVMIAGKKNIDISTPDGLHYAIIEKMPQELHHLIDTVVIDLSPKASFKQ